MFGPGEFIADDWAWESRSLDSSEKKRVFQERPVPQSTNKKRIDREMGFFIGESPESAHRRQYLWISKFYPFLVKNQPMIYALRVRLSLISPPPLNEETGLNWKAETEGQTIWNSEEKCWKEITVYFLPNWIPTKIKNMDTKYPNHLNRAIIKRVLLKAEIK